LVLKSPVKVSEKNAFESQASFFKWFKWNPASNSVAPSLCWLLFIIIQCGMLMNLSSS